MALTALHVKNAKAGDKLGDGGGLRLDVDKNGNKSWVFRFTSPTTGRERFMGLGPLRDVSLAAARDAAQAARTLIRGGKDPIAEKREKRATARIAANRGVTFRQCAERLIDSHEGSWKNARHRQAWRNSLRDYAYPTIGQLPVGDVDVAAVLGILEPIWQTKSETASRVRGRIESVLDWATVAGYRQGENPAMWKGRLVHLLPRRRKADVKHYDALPYDQMPAFWASLAADTSDAARMLRFIILTAARYGEANGMQPSEVQGNLWTIPKERMKGGQAHTVPLTALALAQLPYRPVSDVTLAKCIKRHTALRATTHGFRSTFRDWAGDATDFPRELAEAALAHVLGEVERAYRRGDALEKRRQLMEAWAKYCLTTR
jgi:integrase